MPTIRIEPGKLGIVLRSDARNLKKVLKRGALRGAHRGRTHLVRESPVDRGVLKNAWQVDKLNAFQQETSDGVFAEVVNTSPYAGVVERGMRPGFKMSKAGLEVLAGWVRRKILKVSNRQFRGKLGNKSGPITRKQEASTDDYYQQSLAIARRIAAKFEREGRLGKFFVRDSLGKLTMYAVEEILREVNKYFSSGGGTRGNV